MNKKLIKIFNNAKVIVTGHTGFKGSWLSLWLTSLGAHVTGISIDIPTEISHFKAAGLSKLLDDRRIDIRNAETLKSAITDVQPDFIFHLAAQSLVKKSYSNPVETWHTNTIGTLNILEALRDLQKSCVAVIITSDKCYDNLNWVWGYRETDSLGGPDPYSASKGAAELAIRSYVKSYFQSDGGNIRIGIGRAGNVIGGGDWAEDRIVPDCMRSWSEGSIVQLRNPLATRPWQHVLEPLSGYITLAIALKENANLHGEPFNFGPPAHQNYSVCALVEAMSKHWDRVRWEDVSEQYGGPYESGLLKLNCDKALHHLRWQAVWDFETTVRETVHWYRKYYIEHDTSIADYSLHQINTYCKMAQEKGLTWAL